MVLPASLNEVNSNLLITSFSRIELNDPTCASSFGVAGCTLSLLNAWMRGTSGRSLEHTVFCYHFVSLRWISPMFHDPERRNPLLFSHPVIYSDTHVFFYDFFCVTVYYSEQIRHSVLSLNVNVFDFHLPDLIGPPDTDCGFHPFSGRTPVIVPMIQEIILPQDPEDLLPVYPVSGFLKVFCDLLVSVIYEFLTQKIGDLFQELRFCHPRDS